MIQIKTEAEIKIMKDGGKRLSEVKHGLMESVKEGVSAWEVEELANDLIKKSGGEASFKKVPGYSWATCINLNEGLVHGIPKKEMVFKRGDVVSVDVGLFYLGFHTDTSFTVGLDLDEVGRKFLAVGKDALSKAISQARSGRRIYDISNAMELTLNQGGYSAIRALVGHGVGRELHEEPQIPCFVPGRIEDSPEIKPGMVLAIEVMYALGSPNVELDKDGWTIAMRDGKISGLFEETVAVSYEGPKVLTS